MLPNLGELDIEDYLKAENFYEEEIASNRKPVQGDIIIPYQSMIDTKEYEGKNILGIIIITNQCDIEQKQARYIIYAPIYRATDLLTFTTKKEKDRFRDIIEQNHRTLFYLPPHPSIDMNLGGLVYFENIRSERIEIFYKKNPSPILSLKRPFIDRLCLKIAYFFNRIPINHPKDDKIDDWINNNKLIQQCVEMSKLQQQAGRYIISDTIDKWIRENREFTECIQLLTKYTNANKAYKNKDTNKLEQLINELEKTENPLEKRFIKLKEDYKALSKN